MGKSHTIDNVRFRELLTSSVTFCSEPIKEVSYVCIVRIVMLECKGIIQLTISPTLCIAKFIHVHSYIVCKHVSCILV